MKDMELKGETIYKLTAQIDEEKTTLKLLKKRFKRLAQENMKISADLGSKEKIIQELKAHLNILSSNSNRDKERIKSTLENLQIENSKVKAYLSKSEERSRGLKQKLKVMRNLVKAIKLKGVPVEEIYDNEVKLKLNNPPFVKSRKSFGSFVGMIPTITLSSLDYFDDLDKASSCDFMYSPSVQPSFLSKDHDTFNFEENGLEDLAFSQDISDSRIIKDL